jgi:transmembrane sensor
MARKSRPDNTNKLNQDEHWQDAWREPKAMDAAKKQALLNNINDRIDGNWAKRKRVFLLAVSAAAAILVAIFVKMPGGSMRTSENTWRELASNDSLQKILLDDGSVVFLAPHSSIQVATNFANHRTTTLTKGSAFFSVAKDAQHPFSIAVNKQQVTVIGTAFTINRLDSVDLQLTVKEGKVALNNAGGRNLLTAGQQVYTNGGITKPVQPVNPAAADWWLQQQVRLENISLAELLNRVETYYQVTLQHGAIKPAMKVTLTWDLTITLDDNLKVLNALTGFNIHQTTHFND